MRKMQIDFMGARFWLLGTSGALILVSIAAILFMGLNFGIEFQGGTVINLSQTSGKSIEDVRSAFGAAGASDVQVQSTETQAGEQGFIVRTTENDPNVANEVYGKVVADLGLPPDAGEVTTIGPGWGKNITNAALLALSLSIAAILLYTSLRFEYKMSVTAVIALIHDVIITLGIFALVGREVTPNTIAALLTIIGYSLYDTIVVFHRIR
ncbi:MAG: protein translocase subunit SecF, partial [Coriobacteriia bacterium]|nr:protein translocase subunit SecF [Coriobacteriia bacterium]